MMVSVIVPCQNEERNIAEVLRSLAYQSLGCLEMEILISDGQSHDSTREVIESFENVFFEKGIKLQILNNIKRTTSSGLNLAVRESSGTYIIRIDAHSTIDENYVVDIINGLEENKVDVVGPAIEYYTDGASEIAKSIVAVLNHPLGNGGTPSRNKINIPKLVKHTVMSCYKKTVWDSVGGYDEALLSNEDFEFDFRAHEAGFIILSLPSPKYFPKTRSSVKEFARQRFRYGFWKFKVYVKHPSSLHSRQLVPILAFFSILGGVFFWPILVFQVLGLIFIVEIIRAQSKYKPDRINLFLVLCINYYVWSAGFLWSAFRNIWFTRSEGK